MCRLLALAVSLLLLSLPASAAAGAEATEDRVLAIWRLLDYVGVDYPEAVQDGAVINATEFAEMQEFAGEVAARIAQLPQSPARDALQAQAAELRQAIETHADPALVAQRAELLAGELLAAYPAPLAPAAAPDLSRAPALFEAQCASCHGLTGHGDGVAAAGMDPPPIDFHDAARQKHRSPFALYGIITNGVDGTAMPAYASLSEEDRWALAFYVGQLIYSDAQRERGRALWESSAQARAAVPDVKALTQLDPAQLAAQIGEEPAQDMMAFLRAQPGALTAPAGDAFGQAAAKLRQAAQAYAAGEHARARDLALSAYLDHFEPIEPALAARDAELLTEVEAAMIAFRAALQTSQPSADEIDAQAQSIEALLEQASRRLADTESSAAGAFASSFVILFREGLEALLVLVAMVAFLRKAGRPDAMRYVHAGWVGGLALGGVSWLVATYLITISGAQRELTEAYTGLIAVAILIFVGLWMHGQSLSGRWQQYIKERIQNELSGNRLWGLALLAFVAVYREAFETVLFYRALWEQGAHNAILGGFATGVVVLAAVGYGLFVVGLRLPISQFFQASSWLIAILAVVLAGKAVSAFQEAGSVAITPVQAPTIDWIGLYPTAQTLGAQLAVALVVLGGVAWNLRRQSLMPAPQKS